MGSAKDNVQRTPNAHDARVAQRQVPEFGNDEGGQFGQSKGTQGCVVGGYAATLVVRPKSFLEAASQAISAHGLGTLVPSTAPLAAPPQAAPQQQTALAWVTSALLHSVATHTAAEDNDIQQDIDMEEVLEVIPTTPEDLDYDGVLPRIASLRARGRSSDS